MGTKLTVLVVVTACMVMVCVAPAFAENPAQNAYGGQPSHGVVSGYDASQSAPPTSANRPVSKTATSGSLAFTGFDLGPLALGAVVLIAAGLLLRRRTN